MTNKPIAYADKTGFVTPAPTGSVTINDRAFNFLTPLYTQEEIDSSMAKFYQAQGLNPDGSDPDDVGDTPSLEESEQAMTAEQQDRAENGKAMTGVSMASAAANALGVATKKATKK